MKEIKMPEELKNNYREEAPERDPVLEQQVEPIGDRVFCRRITEEETVEDGIIIPDTSKEKNQEAEVVAVGKGRVTPEGSVVPTTILVGMRVLLPKYGGAEVEIKGVKYQIVTEAEILAIIKRPETKEDLANG